MKISIPLSILILAIGAAVAVQYNRRLLSVTAVHRQLVTEAGKLGIAAAPSDPSSVPRITKRERKNREISAEATATELLGYATEMEAFKKSGKTQPDDQLAFQKRQLEMMDKIASLDSEQIKVFIARIRASTDLTEDRRQGLIGFSIITLAPDHPQAALAIFFETGALVNNEHASKQLISTALTCWAQNDPLGALDWFRINSENHPELVTNEAQRAIIHGTATHDLQLAFRLIEELKITDGQSLFSEMTLSTKTDEDRSATLAAIREQIGRIPDETMAKKFQVNTFHLLAAKVAESGYEPAQKWLSTAKLSPEELAVFADGLADSNKQTGRWIEWMGSNLTADKMEKHVDRMVGFWSQRDYPAAGDWLAATPDSPAKDVAIGSYARTVAAYHPESAARWATTLPPGSARDLTFKIIYSRWPRKDDAGKAAAEAFKREHGME